MSVKSKIFSRVLEERSVAAIRLITGDELIARVSKISTDDSPFIEIDQPRVLVAQLQTKPDGTPVFAAQILNWFNSDPDATVAISFDDIVSVCEPESGVQNEYIRFTTGIELASAGSNIT